MTWLGWATVIRTNTAAAFCDINGWYSWSNEAEVHLKLIDRNGTKVEPSDGDEDSWRMNYLYPDEKLTACDLIRYHSEHPGVTSVPAAEKGKYEALYLKWDFDQIQEHVFAGGEIEPNTDRHQQFPLGIMKSSMPSKDLRLKNLEFKRSLEDLISDFEQDIKSPQQVKFVVAWDEGAVTSSGFELVDLQTAGSHQQRLFHGQTHILVMDPGGAIPVFLLETAIQVLLNAGLIE